MKEINLLNESLTIDSSESYIISAKENILMNVQDNLDVKLYFNEFSSNLTINVGTYSTLNLDLINYLDNQNSLTINLSDNSSLNITTINLANSNSNVIVNLNGFESNVNIKRLVINKDLSSNYKTIVNHNAKSSKAYISNVGVALLNSNILFDTTGQINKGMSKSEIKQLDRGILIGDKASVISKPILKIDEFDVSANHGSAIGKMSDDELFYLMSRGLNKEESYKLILRGQVNPIVDNIWLTNKQEEIKTKIYELI